MSRFEIEHNGVTIVYADNEDKWVCYPLELEADKLSTLKSKITKVLAEARRVENVPVISISRWGDASYGNATLVEGDSVWVMLGEGYKNGIKSKVIRSKLSMNSLVLDTPENRAALTEFRVESRRIAELTKSNEKRLADIPRVTADALKAVGGKK